ncbi:UNVERIFIED_ORG: hypothetical protein QFZ59_005409 [Bacillus sp. B2I3]|nr:hypothetical protein [Bacillus sp. B2I3]
MKVYTAYIEILWNGETSILLKQFYMGFFNKWKIKRKKQETNSSPARETLLVQYTNLYSLYTPAIGIIF